MARSKCQQPIHIIIGDVGDNYCATCHEGPLPDDPGTRDLVEWVWAAEARFGADWLTADVAEVTRFGDEWRAQRAAA